MSREDVIRMARVKRFERNTQGRDLIVGDVHGHFTRLQTTLDAVGFEPARDRLFSVGDLVDRGPECDQALEWLARPWFHAVLGNHEAMAIDWVAGLGDPGLYAANGGTWNISNPPELQREIAEAFRAMPLGIEIETDDGLVGIVHADCPAPSWSEFVDLLQNGSAMDVQHLETMAIWNRQRIEMGDRRGVDGLRALVVGHTTMSDPVVLGNVHHIDTGGWLADRVPSAHFTLLDVATLQVVNP